MTLVRDAPFGFLVFCDDLSFDADDTSYKSLKAVLEGGIEGRPDNVLFYATSNRRHLLPRDMMENERSTAINPGEAVEEKVSLSDRFGLWLGFHRCSQDDYLAMVFGYAERFGLEMDRDTLQAEALEWATTRGARSGRTAWQYIQDLAGRLGKQTEVDASPRLPWPVHQKNAARDERNCDCKARRDLLAKQEMPGCYAKNRRQERERGKLARAVMRDHPEPARIRNADDPECLVGEAAQLIAETCVGTCSRNKSTPTPSTIAETAS